MHWHHPNRHPTIATSELNEVLATNVALASTLGPQSRQRLLELTAKLVAEKRWEPLAPLELTTEIAVTIAANAAIPILSLDLSIYRNVGSIIVRPTMATSFKNRAGPVRGVVTTGALTTIGEATPQSGPLSISWDAALADSRSPGAGRNVVIHEFAHKIDMRDGYSDGTPPLRGAQLERWAAVLADEYERPEVRPGDEVLRPYAWTNAAEFFAVASEAFFCTPAELATAKPQLYDALGTFYRQDPATSTA